MDKVDPIVKTDFSKFKVDILRLIATGFVCRHTPQRIGHKLRNFPL